MPNFQSVVKAFGLSYIKVEKYSQIKSAINYILKNQTPKVCEIIADEEQSSLFKQGYKSNPNGTFTPQPLSEMHPFLNTPIANTNN
jgi:thiamine pyrophosphate-dependent acetolactate synthase large subunit-like protein